MYANRLRTSVYCLLFVLVGLSGPLSIDMYAPAMPLMAKQLGVSATAVQWSLSLYVASSVVGLLFLGVLSDCFGRKYILMLGLFVGVLGALLCSMATSIHIFYAGRVLQSLGLSVIPAVLPAVSRDLFSGKVFQQISSIVSVAFGIGPVASPLIGSYISHCFGWQPIFVTLACYTFLAFLMVAVFLQETHQKEKRHALHLSSMMRTYKHIVTNPIFFKNMFSKAMAWMSFLVFYTVSPFMLQEHLHLSTLHYGWVTLIMTGAILLTKLVNTFLLRVMDINAIIRWSLWGVLLGSLLSLSFGLLGYYSVVTIVAPFVIIGLAAGFLFSNTTPASFQGFKGVSSGSVAGLLNGMQIMIGFVGSAIAAHLTITVLWPLGTLMTVVSLACLLVYYRLSRPHLLVKEQAS